MVSHKRDYCIITNGVCFSNKDFVIKTNAFVILTNAFVSVINCIYHFNKINVCQYDKWLFVIFGWLL